MLFYGTKHNSLYYVYFKHIFTKLVKSQFSYYFEQQYLKTATKQAINIFIETIKKSKMIYKILGDFIQTFNLKTIIKGKFTLNIKFTKNIF